MECSTNFYRVLNQYKPDHKQQTVSQLLRYDGQDAGGGVGTVTAIIFGIVRNFYIRFSDFLNSFYSIQ